MICCLVKCEILTAMLLLWRGTLLLAAPRYRTAVTPADYQAGVVVELHPSHMTTETGLVLWLGLGISRSVLQERREHIPAGTLLHTAVS